MRKNKIASDEKLVDKRPVMSASKCLKYARMLVPKFSFQHDEQWHIQWPMDQATVVHADTEKLLVIRLAARLQALGRVGNDGPHVSAEYP